MHTKRNPAGNHVPGRSPRRLSELSLGEAAERWLRGIRDGSIRNKSGDVFKPSTVRGYDEALRLRVLPELGSRRLAELDRLDVQDFVDDLVANGLNPSTIRNTLMPLRTIMRRALARGEIEVNPTTGVEIPAVRGRRDRIASPREAATLIAALPESERAIWATALYAGLRRGELMALEWGDVDLEGGIIHVRRSWDIREGIIEPKSRAGWRSVPMAGVLREYLVARKRHSTWSKGLAFGRSPTQPFEPVTLAYRARKAWAKTNEYETKRALDGGREPYLLEPITLHEARHTFASLMIAAGVGAKELSAYMGHASVMITLDRYGHLMPGNEREAAERLDSYLARASAASASAG